MLLQRTAWKIKPENIAFGARNPSLICTDAKRCVLDTSTLLETDFARVAFALIPGLDALATLRPDPQHRPSEGIDAGRMEAFSDGVIAIIVTIMVLELRPPEQVGLDALIPLWPTFLAYALSFSLVAIYWVNHHNLLHAARRVGNDTLWLNVHFLFWLSLFPFAAAYIGDTRGAPFSVALYAALSTVVAGAYAVLNRNLIQRNPAASSAADVAGRRLKNLAAIGLTASAIPLAFVNETVAVILLAAPAIAYILPFSSEGGAHPAESDSRGSGLPGRSEEPS